ncbi:MAG: hypothetical protein ACYCVE_14615, partial [Gemmatimonadaceae bacterium]
MQRTHLMHISFARALAIGGLVVAAACSGPTPQHAATSAAPTAGTPYVVADSTIQSVLDAAGTAQPITEATLSTKLMGTVTDVLVHEGDVVAAGQPLVHIDARDLVARDAQIQAAIAGAEAVQHDAETQDA